MSKPLTGIRIIDLTRVLAGPWASQLLADLGAEVIKVERPGAGDDSRGYGPPFLKAADGRDLNASAMFLSANRNKKSVTVNLGEPDGAEIVRQLAATADVFMENYKVGDMARFGLDYDTLSAANPRLIYCSVTGYGQTGPYSDRGGYDPVAQAMCGMMSVTGLPEDVPGGGPMKTGPSLVDIITGLYAVVGIQGALLHLAKTGRGQQLDVSLLDCGVAVMAQQAAYYLLTGVQPPPVGNQANGGAPGGDFRCSDGRIMIAPGNQAGYARLCATLGRSDLVTDPRFLTNGTRVQNRELLNGILNEEMSTWTARGLHEALLKARVPSSLINNLEDVMADPQVAHRRMVATVEHPSAGAVRLVGNPLHYSAMAVNDHAPPPELGQHTEAVLAELGYSDSEVAVLRDRRIV